MEVLASLHLHLHDRLNKEALRAFVRPRSRGGEHQVTGLRVPVRELDHTNLLFGTPAPSAKTPGMVNIPVRNQAGEVVKAVFDAGGEFPPFAVQDPGSPMYSKSTKPEYIIQFQVGNGAERKAVDSISQYLEDQTVANKDRWVTWTPWCAAKFARS